MLEDFYAKHLKPKP